MAHERQPILLATPQPSEFVGLLPPLPSASLIASRASPCCTGRLDGLARCTNPPQLHVRHRVANVLDFFDLVVIHDLGVVVMASRIHDRAARTPGGQRRRGIACALARHAYGTLQLHLYGRSFTSCHLPLSKSTQHEASSQFWPQKTPSGNAWALALVGRAFAA